MKKAILLATVLFVAACQTDTSDGATISNTAPTVKSCQAEGGKLMNAKAGAICSMPTSDAGQKCTSSSQCVGLCMANGQCSAHESNFGCQDVLEDGVRVTICID
ncbi:hypothetical protein T7987_00050 [Sulfitobacter faviae]|uniref:Lipoprotein n=1 Tax=Sulfitobacter faviae TaxID=1775881 RepID=A0ABZ0V0X1_9RHOB|nr:hypothetical protein [Sulfitobacter faviae]WPZ21673.1 hypothetical protein T7987_00050 [Sulfitobacter faviae]